MKITPGYRFTTESGSQYTVIRFAAIDLWLCLLHNNEIATKYSARWIEEQTPMLPVTTLDELDTPFAPLASAGEIWTFRGASYLVLNTTDCFADLICVHATAGDTVRTVNRSELGKKVGRIQWEQ